MGTVGGDAHLVPVVSFILFYYIMTTKAKEKKWEIKDRFYTLNNGKSPLSWRIQTKHLSKKPLLHFDEDKGVNREIRYATNQSSLFVDEQDGYVTLGHVFFTNGGLHVPKNKVALQKLLSIYHPLAGKLWIELDSQAIATD